MARTMIACCPQGRITRDRCPRMFWDHRLPGHRACTHTESKLTTITVDELCIGRERGAGFALTGKTMDLMETLPAARCKRRRMSDELWTSGDCPTAPLSVISRQFFTVHKGGGVFETEEWRGGDKTTFRPVVDDLMVGVQRVEQVTCQDGSFFVTDLLGRYSRTVPGKVVHLWRFDKTQRRLYISRSFLFTNTAEFVAVQQFLQHL